MITTNKEVESIHPKANIDIPSSDHHIVISTTPNPNTTPTNPTHDPDPPKPLRVTAPFGTSVLLPEPDGVTSVEVAAVPPDWVLDGSVDTNVAIVLGSAVAMYVRMYEMSQ